MVCIMEGHTQIVDWFLNDSPVPPNVLARTPKGDTALHLAAKHGALASAQLLLESGANPNEPGDLGQTPLHIAAIYNRVSLARVLLLAGAAPSAKNAYGNSPSALCTTGSPMHTLLHEARRADQGIQRDIYIYKTYVVNPSTC